MNFDQRKSFRIQIPEGREHATLVVGKREFQARILDESAGGFAVALIEDVDIQQNHVHVLKTAAGSYQTRVARIEQYADGKILGLVRLNDPSEALKDIPQVATWRDYLFPPHYAGNSGGGSIALGIGLAVVMGALICGLVHYGLQYLPSARTPATSQYLRDFSDAVNKSVDKAHPAAREAAKVGRETSVLPSMRPLVTSAVDASRQQEKFMTEVSSRLRLSSEQSQRIRDILNRSSSDLASVKGELRSVLTAEQFQELQSLSP